MVKAYQRYLPGENGGRIGVVASSLCGDVAWMDERGVVALTAALDALTLWNLRTGTLVASLRDDSVSNPSPITALSCSHREGRMVAAGHSDGSVRLWDRVVLNLVVTLEGHRSSVSCIAWHMDNTLVASGSLDTDIIVWDPVQESGLYRLRGHKDAVTALAFFSTSEGESRLASASKDGLVKIWDVAQQQCIHTLAGHQGEVWALTINPVSKFLVSGGQDMYLRMWSLHTDAPTLLGTVPKASKARAATLAFCNEGSHLVCHTADKSVQLFRVRPHDEAMHKMRRRLKRKRENEEGDAAEGENKGESDADSKEINSPTAADMLEAVNVLSASAKVRAISIVSSPRQAKNKNKDSEKSGPLRVLCALSNNALEVHSVPTRRPELPSVLSLFHAPAHRNDVRAIALSEQEGLAVACSGDEVKAWSLGTQQCIQTISVKPAVCCCLLPGDRWVSVRCM
jgi:U3 small nucleolar RNA-associated protein 12